MMMRPRTNPPYLPFYPKEDWARIQSQYELDEREWQRELNMLMWLNSIPVVCAAIGVIAAAIIGPSVVVDMIMILK